MKSVTYFETIVSPETTTLKDMRGMSEPFYFSFNTGKFRTDPLIAHAVIFTSHIVADEKKEMKLAEPADDPRFGEFIRFAIGNYEKGTKEKLDQLSDEISKRHRELEQLEKRIKTITKEVEREHP